MGDRKEPESVIGLGQNMQLGKKHINTALSYHDIGITYYLMEKYAKALKYQKKA